MPRCAGGEELALVGGAASLRRPQRRGARGEHHPSHARAQALAEHRPHASHVHLEQPLGVRRAHGGHARRVEDLVDTLQRPPHRATVEQVAPHPLDVEVFDRRGVRALPDRHAQVLAAIGERASQMRADEAGGAGQECLGHDPRECRAARCPRVAAIGSGDARSRRDATPPPTSRPTWSTGWASRWCPLYVNFGSERTERESDIVDYHAFFEELRGAEELPTTSQPSVGDFASAYEPLLSARPRRGLDSHLRAPLGHGGLRTAGRRAARTRGQGRRAGPGDRLRDAGRAAWACSRSSSTAAAKAGLDLDAIEARVAEAREDLKIWFALDTLEFLKRGGRIGAASAWIGSTLRVKPILTVESGQLTPVERVRTSLARVRAAYGLRPPASRVGRGWMGGPAHLGARPGRASSPTAAARCSGATRCSSARSGRCCRPTWGRDCWVWARSPRHLDSLD